MRKIRVVYFDSDRCLCCAMIYKVRCELGSPQTHDYGFEGIHVKFFKKKDIEWLWQQTYMSGQACTCMVTRTHEIIAKEYC